MTHSRSEHTLWRRWVNRRDAQAFDELVRRHARFVYDFARRVAGNASDAEDLTQEAYLELADADPGVPERVGLRSFLGRRIVLGARMLRRAALSRQRRDPRGVPPSPAPGPEDLDRREQAETALSLLEKDERHAVELRFLHDLSYAEIGHVLGLTEEAARMRVHRSLKRLRARLGPEPAILLAALPIFDPPAGLLASTAKTALLTGGVVVMQKKLTVVVVLLLLMSGIGALSVHLLGREASDVTARAPRSNGSVDTTDPTNTAEEPPVNSPLPGAVVGGKVVDEQGAPVPDALVRVFHSHYGAAPLETRTDVAGAFSVALATDRKKCTVEARHPDYATARVTAKVVDPFRLVLKRGATVRVEVSADGKPVAGALVAAPTRSNVYRLDEPGFRTSADATTDDAGTASLHVSPGTYFIWARGTGWAPKLSDPVVCAIGDPRTVRIELDSGGQVRGVVQAGDVGPVSDARVVVRARTGFRSETRTDSEGRYLFVHVPLGSACWLQVVADHPDHAATSSSRKWNAGDGNRMRFDLVLTTGARLHGVVLDVDGRPLPRRTVVLIPEGYFHLLYGHSWADGWPFGATTDRLGRFELAGLPAGDATLYLKGDGAVKTDVTLTEGKTHGPVELRPAKGQVVSGRVRDADGTPLANARLFPAGVTDAKGRFEVALPQGAPVMVVQAPGHVPFQQSVRPGTDVEIRLPGAALAGTVIRSDGEGIADAEVIVMITFGDMGYRSTARTDEQGRFRLRGATEATYDVEVRAQGLVAAGAQRVKGPRDDLVFVLATHAEAERRRVRGVIVDADTGDPIGEAVVYGIHKGDGTVIRSWHTAERRAGSAGGFVCPVLNPAGAMKLVFAAKGYLNSDPIDVTYDGRTFIEPLTVRLRRGGTIEVVVLEESGTPVAGAFVYCHHDRGVFARTDPEGRCVLAGIAPGRQRVTASHPYLAIMKEQYVDVTTMARRRVEFRGKTAGKITIRLPKGVRPKNTFAITLRDDLGTVVFEVTLKRRWLDMVDRSYPERWQYDIVVTQSGSHHLSCELDAVTLPTKAVMAQLRKTVTVDLELDD